MSTYCAYLLRLWTDKDAPLQWRFSLEDPHTHCWRGFANLEELVRFLQTDTQAAFDSRSNRTNHQEVNHDDEQTTEILDNRPIQTGEQNVTLDD